MEPWIIIIMLGAAALIYAVMLPRKQEGKISSEQMVKEVEATLEQYMADIEEENDTLVDLVGQMKNDTSAKQLAMEEQMRVLQQKLLQLEQQSEHQATLIMDAEQERLLQGSALAELKSSKKVMGDISEPQTDEIVVAENSIKHRYTELFDMYNQGKSIDLIGKSIGLQRGEVQLILQLAKQEESL